MSTLPRLALVATITGLLLAACANHPATRSDTASSDTARSSAARATAARASASESATSNARHTAEQRRSAPTGQADNAEPDRTGVPACDDYLTSYLACHRAAAIYTPEQLPLRYQAMRTSLLRDSKNPKIRPHLADRCNSLARTLRQALHGKSCEVSAAPASSSP
jgi:hypothetical protein